MWDVIIVGAGPGGLMAALNAAKRNRRTLVLEKNNKPGLKILISGGGRCNLTHATDRRGIVDAFGKNGSFLHSALAALGPSELIGFFEQHGVKTKTEDSGKVFPASDKASDILRVLLEELRNTRCTISLNESLQEIEYRDETFYLKSLNKSLTAKNIVLATGGQSYPETGSSGDGYLWARKLGHKVITPRPVLVPLKTKAEWVKSLQGISMQQVAFRLLLIDKILQKVKVISEQRGDLLFTHFGVSGPVVLNISREILSSTDLSAFSLECDFLPDLDVKTLEQNIINEISKAGKRLVSTIMGKWFPSRLSETIVKQANLPQHRKACDLSQKERRSIVEFIKGARFPLSSTAGFSKAEVTRGGVSLDEVNSSNMESKIVKGLFFAGEILDLDGPIGGFNLQAAFSTGYLAGEYV